MKLAIELCLRHLGMASDNLFGIFLLALTALILKHIIFEIVVCTFLK